VPPSSPINVEHLRGEECGGKIWNTKGGIAKVIEREDRQKPTGKEKKRENHFFHSRGG